MKITDSLAAEHRVFLRIFDRIEQLLPGLRTVRELRLLGALLESLLADHGRAEAELAYAALDHVLHDQGRLDRLHQEHDEIDASLREVAAAGDAAHARRLLELALRASRDHFGYEERFVFPLLEQALQGDTLSALAAEWHMRGPDA